MAIPLLSENDISLLQAVKPFLSQKSQDMVDVMVTVFNVFKPLQEGEGVDVDALATLMDKVHASAKSKKSKEKSEYVEAEEDDATLDEDSGLNYETKDVENLLNLLSEKANENK